MLVLVQQSTFIPRLGHFTLLRAASGQKSQAELALAGSFHESTDVASTSCRDLFFGEAMFGQNGLPSEWQALHSSMSYSMYTLKAPAVPQKLACSM